MGTTESSVTQGDRMSSMTFEVEPLGEGADALNLEENVNPDLIDLTVLCMADVMSGTPAKMVFANSLSVARRIGGDAFAFEARHLIDDIKGLDDESITNAVKLSGLITDPGNHQPIEEINPDEATIQNVRTMVERLLCFYDEYGAKSPIFDALWDVEVSKTWPTIERILRLLVYWRMGLHSPRTWQFQNVNRLGIYNPRLNEVHQISVDDIPEDVIDEIDQNMRRYSE